MIPLVKAQQSLLELHTGQPRPVPPDMVGLQCHRSPQGLPLPDPTSLQQRSQRLRQWSLQHGHPQPIFLLTDQQYVT